MEQTIKQKRIHRLKLGLWTACLLVIIWGVWVTLYKIPQISLNVLNTMPGPKPHETILVFAPHEDDETVGAGGYLQQAIAVNAEVYVCLMTCGEGEELGAAFANKRVFPKPQAFINLGNNRRKETLRVMAKIGLPQDHVIFLNYPNDGLDSLWSAKNWSHNNLWKSPYTKTDHSPFEGGVTPHAPFAGTAVLNDITTLLNWVRPDRIFTLHPSDIHRDHWATYNFVKLALEEIKLNSKASWAQDCEVYTYIVHQHNWPAPWGYHPNLKLTPPPSLAKLPVNHWYSFPLEPVQIATKNQLTLMYRSQMARFDLLLRAFSRQSEIFAKIDDINLNTLAITRQGLFIEPVADSKRLHEQPFYDIAEVVITSDGVDVQVKIRTMAPVNSRVMLATVLHMVSPVTCTPHTLLVRAGLNKPAEVWMSDDQQGPLGVPQMVNCAKYADDTLTITLPYSYIGNGQPVMVDVMSLNGRHIQDHSITRTVHPEPAKTAETLPLVTG